MGRIMKEALAQTLSWPRQKAEGRRTMATLLPSVTGALYALSHSIIITKAYYHNRETRHSKVKQLAQVHTAPKCPNNDMNGTPGKHLGDRGSVPSWG